jgi:hypothetical protein
MVNRRILLALVAVAVCVIGLAAADGGGAVDELPPLKFDGIDIYAYGNGLTGFFDRATGTIYIYDGRWEKCVTVRRVDKLGEPMIDLTPKPGRTTLSGGPNNAARAGRP